MRDLSTLSYEDIIDIVSGMDRDEIFYDYDFFGIRCIEPEYLMDMRNSYVWIDGDMTDEELDGVSAIDTKMLYQYDIEENARRLELAIKRSKPYAHFGRKPYLIMSTYAEEGNDVDEIIMQDAVVLDISEYI